MTCSFQEAWLSPPEQSNWRRSPETTSFTDSRGLLFQEWAAKELHQASGAEFGGYRRERGFTEAKGFLSKESSARLDPHASGQSPYCMEKFSWRRWKRPTAKTRTQAHHPFTSAVCTRHLPSRSLQSEWEHKYTDGSGSQLKGHERCKPSPGG